MRVIKLYLDQGVVVICAGGGIPILRRETVKYGGYWGGHRQDAASALLAAQLKTVHCCC